MSVFNTIKNRDHTASLAFLDAGGPVSIQRYENQPIADAKHDSLDQGNG